MSKPEGPELLHQIKESLQFDEFIAKMIVELHRGKGGKPVDLEKAIREVKVRVNARMNQVLSD